MRRNAGIHVKDVYKRFLISFFLVLILPVAIFFIVFLRDYYQIYQDKIIEQAEKALENTTGELERELEGLWAIASYNNEISHMKDYMVKSDYTGNNVINTLKAEVSTHSILDDIYYYTEAVPNWIYSQYGTYSWNNFINLYIGTEKEEQFIQGVKQKTNKGWSVWNTSNGGNAWYKHDLYYTVQIAKGKLWMFSISSERLKEILNNEFEYTVLLDADGTQLFPIEADTIETQNKYFEIVSKSADGSFSLVRKIDKKELFSELYHWRIYFIITMAAVLGVGSMLAFMLASYNERPVKELQELCREKIESIPEHIEGFEAFKFAMKKMESQVTLTEEKQKKNLFLLSLLLGGHEQNAEKLYAKMKKEGIFTKAEMYCVLAAEAEERVITDNSRLELYMHTEFPDGYEIYRVDMEQEHPELFIVGMTKEKSEQLEEELLKMIDFFENSLSRKLFFYIGEFCRQPMEIQNSYRSIITQEKTEKATENEKLFFCKIEKAEKVQQSYPDEELEELYEALEEADINKVSIMTEILISFLKQYEDNRFLYLSIYYDIVNTYYRAQSKLILNLESAFLELELLEIKDYADAIQIVKNLKEQYQNCMEGKEEKKEKDVLIQIVDYIEENKKSAELSVSTVADFFGMSMSNLSHRFKLYTNQKISDYITEKRLEYAVELLEQTDYRVSDIGEMLGYTQTSSFIRKFRQYYGMTPLEYRKQKSGSEVL